jgi:hypothetical protein
MMWFFSVISALSAANTVRLAASHCRLYPAPHGRSFPTISHWRTPMPTKRSISGKTRTTKKTSPSSRRKKTSTRGRQTKKMSLTLTDGSKVIASMRGGKVERVEAFSKSGRKLPVRYETSYEGPGPHAVRMLRLDLQTLPRRHRALHLACSPKSEPVGMRVPMSPGRAQETLKHETQTTFTGTDHQQTS